MLAAGAGGLDSQAAVAAAVAGSPLAKFIVSDWGWGDEVDSGIGLSYRPARLHRLAGRYDNPICRCQLRVYIPRSGTMHLDTASSTENFYDVFVLGKRVVYEKLNSSEYLTAKYIEIISLLTISFNVKLKTY
jgi:hypothetical protein